MNTEEAEKQPGKLRQRARRAKFLGALVGAALTVLAGFLALFRIGGSLVSLSYDLPFIAHRAGEVEELRVVYLDKLAGGRLDRTIQAGLLDALNEAGTRAVVYDIMFDQPWDPDDPSVDEEFAAAIRRFRGVGTEDRPLPETPQRPVTLAFGRELISQAGASGERLIPPIDVLLDAAGDFGLAILLPDKTTYTARQLVTGTVDEPSLAWSAALSAGANLSEEQRLDPRWINYAGPPTDPSKPAAEPAIRSCTASDVLGGVDPGFFRNKIVVIGGQPGIGGTAAGEDLFSTPFHRFHQRELPLMSGADLQANVIANLIEGNWLTRSSERSDLYLIIAIGILAGVGCVLLRPVWATIAAVAGAVVLVLAGIWVLHYGRTWFPWSVPAMVQIPVALVLGVSTSFSVEYWLGKSLEEQQRRLREAFALYLSPQMLEQLTREDFDWKLQGRKAEVAIMMTDLATYTNLCERIKDPARIVKTLQNYFKRVTVPIFDQHGLILHFAGDGLLAAWGTPIAEPHPDPDARINVVRAAWEISEINRMVVEGIEVQTRIGLNFGEVLAGNIGSEKHVAYSLTGDPVNLTARLEGLNKLFGTSILMSRSVYEHPEVAKEFRTRRIGKFQVKGREEPTEVYELLGPMVEEREPEWINLYHEALLALEAEDRELARERFEAADAAHSKVASGTGGLLGDGASRFFIDLLNKGEPMPDGVVVVSEK